MSDERPVALVVEDDRSAREALAELVREDGFRVDCAETLEEARRLLAGESPDLILTDLVLPDGSGTELLLEVDVAQATQCAVITGHASVDSAVESLRQGAVDYLTKPIDVGRLQALLATVKRTYSMQREIRGLRSDLRGLGRFGALVGMSPPMQELYDVIGKLAPTDVSVLLVGESGTGKDVVAETIHRLGRRHDGPFVPVNCGALPANLVESELFGHERGSFTGADRQHRGFFERASGGTLLLDEIGSTPVEFQVKLLRVLETSRLRRVGGEESLPIDVRVLAATNREPEVQIEEGALREDLYYRLKVFMVRLPPLRDRGDDVLLLAEHFLGELNRANRAEKHLRDDARAVLMDYAWPGNVRELRNVIAHAFVLATEGVGADDLPAEIRAGGSASPSTGAVPSAAGASQPAVTIRVGTSIAEAERELILATLHELDGNKERTASTLGISLKTLYNRLNQYGTRR